MRINDRDHIGRRLNSLVECALHRRMIRLTCRRCSHSALFDAVPMWWKFDRRGWSGLFEAVRKRFYCSACWQQRHAKIREPRIEVSDEAPPPALPGYPYPDERTWKRLVSRYRS